MIIICWFVFFSSLYTTSFWFLIPHKSFLITASSLKCLSQRNVAFFCFFFLSGRTLIHIWSVFCWNHKLGLTLDISNGQIILMSKYWSTHLFVCQSVNYFVHELVPEISLSLSLGCFKCWLHLFLSFFFFTWITAKVKFPFSSFLAYLTLLHF